MSEIEAVLFLSEGQECRCVQVPRDGVVGDLIEHMIAAQQEWEELGSAGSRAITFRGLEDSCTDTESDRYAVVLRTESPQGASERILPRAMPLASPELAAVRLQWERIALQHMAARVRQLQLKSQTGDGARLDWQGLLRQRTHVAGQQTKKAAAGKSKSKPREYWFVSPAPKTTQSDVRLKFVSVDQYVIAKPKVGWLDVKHNGKIKSLWVVVREDTLFCFSDADGKSLVVEIKGINSFEIHPKKGKGEQRIVKFKRGSSKISLFFDNDLLEEKWLLAIKQGASGLQAKSGGQSKPTIAIKPACLEMIPEYTEEEEMSAERAAANARGLYMFVQDALVTSTGGVKLNSLPADGGYLTSGQVFLNQNGQYLTVETMKKLCQDAGYLTMGEAQQLLKQPPTAGAEAAYLSIEAMRTLQAAGSKAAAPDQLVSKDTGTYMDVATLQRVCHDAGYFSAADVGEAIYMSVDD